MNNFKLLFFLLMSNQHMFHLVKSGLSAINSRWHVRKLYQEIRNEGEPLKSDRAKGNAEIRRQICEDITHSGYFSTRHFQPINLEDEMERNQLKSLHPDMFSRIYVPRSPPVQQKEPPHSSLLNFFSIIHSSENVQEMSYEYSNPFFPQVFEVRGPDVNRMELQEYVFVCLLEDQRNGGIYPYYVSKEYNVVGNPYRAGRFLFTEGRINSIIIFMDMLLAEEPGEVDEEQSKQVELEYLRRRKYGEPAHREDSDPICRLIPFYGPDNQEDRLCAMVMTSSHFRETTLQYPESWFMSKCTENHISFSDDDLIKEVGDMVYSERMLRCQCRNTAHNSYDHFYISRAYRSNQVFVYRYDFRKGEIYLENLTVNVGIVREPFFINDVED